MVAPTGRCTIVRGQVSFFFAFTIHEDLFALSALGEKRNGYFVEFGDGIRLGGNRRRTIPRVRLEACREPPLRNRY
jgi:hypothetical protein